MGYPHKILRKKNVLYEKGDEIPDLTVSMDFSLKYVKLILEKNIYF
jgi:hypothetical protein